MGGGRRGPLLRAALALTASTGLAAGGLATLAVTVGAVPALAAVAPSCSAGTCTVTFATVGTGQSFTVPAGVSSLTVMLYGGTGGPSGSQVSGGDGALVTAALGVSPGEVLGVDVGGAGAVDTGGLNGGGGNSGGGGGGGGATDVTSAGTTLLVAGGGGGGGVTAAGFNATACDNSGALAAGGAGGNADNPGGAGQSTSSGGLTLGGGGGGAAGTTSGPGAGGSGGTFTGTDPCGTAYNGQSGAPGVGGSGGTVIGPDYGGAGGGGYFGGGAGGDGAFQQPGGSAGGGGGGGGGASYTGGAAASPAPVVNDTGNDGSVNGGNGKAVFSYPDPISTGTPSYTTTAGQALTVDAAGGLLSPAAGTSGPAGDTLTASGPASTTQGGTLSINSDGSFTYTPPSGFSGSDGFTYTVSDGFDYATGNATITVQASPTLATTPSPGSVTLGTTAPTLKDTAVLDGGSSPTGSITFRLFDPSSNVVHIETVAVNGNGTYTTPTGYTLPTDGRTVTGTYTWTAFYSGDGNNTPASGPGGPGEQTTVSPAHPTLATTPSPAPATLGATLKDSADLEGGYYETREITFLLHDPNGNTVFTETVAVDGNGTYTTPTGYTVPPGAATGTYHWNAVYSGDGNNNGVGEFGEPVTVTLASPAITSTPGGTVVTGSKLSDSATLTGGASPGGTITFTLYGPNSNSTLADTETVTVHGDGTYTTPAGFTPTTAGTYQWVAAYSGDGSNNPVSTHLGDEPQTALYGFGGFLSPLPKSTLQKSGSAIPVKFRLTNTAGQPISSSVAAALAAAGDVKATLTGPGISPQSALCTWNSTNLLFQCNIKTPTGLKTGTANPYQITAYENVGAGFVLAPAVATASTPNPETIFFK
jgi:hypothetical protein